MPWPKPPRSPPRGAERAASRDVVVDQLFITLELVPATALLRTQAAGGEPKAQYQLGIAYKEGAGVEKDLGQAASWFARAAAQGDARAKYQMARVCGLRKDVWVVVRRCEIAAAQGDRGSMYRLGELYQAGITVLQSAARARGCYARAAAKGHPGAAQALKEMQLVRDIMPRGVGWR